MESEVKPLLPKKGRRFERVLYRANDIDLACSSSTEEFSSNDGTSADSSYIDKQAVQVKPSRIETITKENPFGWSVFLSASVADFGRKVAVTSLLVNLVLFSLDSLETSGFSAVVILHLTSFVVWLTSALSCLISERSISTYMLSIIGLVILASGIVLLTTISALISEGTLAAQLTSLTAFLTVSVGAGLATASLSEFNRSQTHFGYLCLRYSGTTTRLYWISHLIALIFAIIIIFIQQETTFGAGFGIEGVILLCSLIIFSLASRRHEGGKSLHGRPAKLLLSVFKEARIVKATFLSKRNTFEDAIGHQDSTPPKTFLDHAAIKFGGTFDTSDVDDVISFTKIAFFLPTFIPYWTVHGQGFGTFIYQGLHLQLDVGKVQLPVAVLPLFGILLALFLFLVGSKFLSRVLKWQNHSISKLWNVILAMFCGSSALIAAAFLDLKARQKYDIEGYRIQKVHGRDFPAVGISVLYQLPQYTLWATSEILVGMSVMKLISESCPLPFRRLVIGCHYLMIASGNLVACILLCCGWFPSDYFDGAAFELYFFLLGGAMIVGTLLFIALLPENGKNESTPLRTAEEKFDNSPQVVGTCG